MTQAPRVPEAGSLSLPVRTAHCILEPTRDAPRVDSAAVSSSTRNDVAEITMIATLYACWQRAFVTPLRVISAVAPKNVAYAES